MARYALYKVCCSNFDDIKHIVQWSCAHPRLKEWWKSGFLCPKICKLQLITGGWGLVGRHWTCVTAPWRDATLELNSGVQWKHLYHRRKSSAVLCPSLNEKMPSSSDKTFMLISLAAATSCISFVLLLWLFFKRQIVTVASCFCNNSRDNDEQIKNSFCWILVTWIWKISGLKYLRYSCRARFARLATFQALGWTDWIWIVMSIYWCILKSNPHLSIIKSFLFYTSHDVVHE